MLLIDWFNTKSILRLIETWSNITLFSFKTRLCRSHTYVLYAYEDNDNTRYRYSKNDYVIITVINEKINVVSNLLLKGSNCNDNGVTR